MKREFLGRGWKFPVDIGDDGAFLLSEESEDIREAILIILKTAKGERVMEPEFGCGIHSFVFEVINSVTMTRMREDIRKALLLYEPRIEVMDIRSEYIDSGILKFDIEYRVISTNSRYNIVYPYHMSEGR
ncbi:GPW/gp25 family protein [Sulfurovum sp. bin170]|uniref:GPW/gp25 family protein n=1 Tax=Sulfurovum sp. bin170 TaxID=2695268 RepID=UPI0013DF289F|nr:GPW/gp25 family protein [Sulfurovum sp. bin170]NEW61372.1 GPW/gp25 family protein [Sulfurovum sp. bin170]